jgi:hypothetical protein
LRSDRNKVSKVDLRVARNRHWEFICPATESVERFIANQLKTASNKWSSFAVSSFHSCEFLIEKSQCSFSLHRSPKVEGLFTENKYFPSRGVVWHHSKQLALLLIWVRGVVRLCITQNAYFI